MNTVESGTNTVCRCDSANGGGSNLLNCQRNLNFPVGRDTACCVSTIIFDKRKISARYYRLLRRFTPRKDRKIRVIASDHALRGRAAICWFVSKGLFGAVIRQIASSTRQGGSPRKIVFVRIWRRRSGLLHPCRPTSAHSRKDV